MVPLYAVCLTPGGLSTGTCEAKKKPAPAEADTGVQCTGLTTRTQILADENRGATEAEKTRAGVSRVQRGRDGTAALIRPHKADCSGRWGQCKEIARRSLTIQTSAKYSSRPQFPQKTTFPNFRLLYVLSVESLKP